MSVEVCSPGSTSLCQIYWRLAKTLLKYSSLSLIIKMSAGLDFWTYYRTTHEEYLQVFIIVQNVVGFHNTNVWIFCACWLKTPNHALKWPKLALRKG